MIVIAVGILGEDFFLHQPFHEGLHGIGASLVTFPGIDHSERINQFRVFSRWHMAAKVLTKYFLVDVLAQ